MRLTKLPIDGPVRVELDRLEDERGFFARSYCSQEFAEHGLFDTVAQVNTSFTAQMGSVRGIHFQREPHSEAKLVRVVRGAIFDVVVDLRADSPTFGQWISEELSADNRTMLAIPEGFGHGFQTLTDDVEMIYLHSVPYAPESNGGIRFDDPAVGIVWPLPINLVSPKDLTLPLLDDLEPLVP